MTRRLVEVAIFWEEGRQCGEMLSTLPSEHADEAGRHALAMFRRLEPGPKRNHLLEALMRRWPSEGLKVALELPTEEEKARVIQGLVLHRSSWASLEALAGSLLQLARGLEDPAWRSRALQSLMLVVPEGSRPQLSLEILSAARQLGPNERAAALGDSTRHLPEALAPDVIELLRDTPRDKSWFRAHEGLVPYLPEEQLDQLLDEATRLGTDVLQEVCHPEFQDVSQGLGIGPRLTKPGVLRALVLLTWIARHPGQSCERLIDRALTLVVVEPEAQDVRAKVLARLAPMLGALPERLKRMADRLSRLVLKELRPGGISESPLSGSTEDLRVPDVLTDITRVEFEEPAVARSPPSPRSPVVHPLVLPPSLEDFERFLPPAEPVLLGTSVPAKVSPGDDFTARFVACVERLEQEVAAKLELLSPGASTVIGFQRCQWQLGSRLRVRVTSPHLLISPDEQEFVWNADASVLDFGVQVPKKARGRRTSLQFEVFFEGARVALLRHDLSVALWRRAAARRRVRVSRAPRTAFASFASDDRNRVLDRVASLRLGAGLDVFMDCLSLRPGEEWKKALRNEIKQRELFLLFWSRHAQASQWVEWEWRTALRLKKREAIQPHPLDPVAVAPPPKELAMLHFGDPYVMLRREE